MIATAEGVAQRASELASSERLLDALDMLHGIPSRAGDERKLADAVCAWGRRAAPASSWRVDPLGGARANLVAAFPAERGDGRCDVMLYTHLDTTLSGDPRLDYPLTGIEAEPPAALERDGDELRGLGLAVSKAPAACALVAHVAFAAACRELEVDSGSVGVLLTAGGTHRAPSGGFPAALPEGLDEGLGSGVEAALRRGIRPRAVINAKGGAPGVLREEPGCMLLRLEVRDAMAPVPARGRAGGAAVRAAQVACAVEAWREAHAGAHRPDGREVAADAGVGAIESGLPYKPDVLPAAGNVYVYVVLLPEADPAAVVAELEAHVDDALGRLDPDWSAGCLRTHVYGLQPGAATAASSPVVRAAREAWDEAFGAGASDVRHYTGSTDGVIFRRHGIDTVRMGVTARALPGNQAVDAVSLGRMTEVAGVYVRTMARLAKL